MEKNFIEIQKTFEIEILHALLNNSKYFSNVMPYLSENHFSKVENKFIFEKIKDLYAKSGETVNIKDVILMIKNEPDSKITGIKESLSDIIKSKIHANNDLLLEKTEEFIKNSIRKDALMIGAEGIGEHDEAKIQESYALMEQASKITLDEDFGFNLSEIDIAIDYYQDDTQGFKLNISNFDKRIGKGFREKTLHAIAAPAGIGKSATMAAFVSGLLKQGKNVTVFTLEMDEKEWAKRIYSNILNINIRNFDTINPLTIQMAWDNIKENLGVLTIKEYPSYGVNALNIENFLEKYEQKTGISDPIVFIDYLGLMNSSRINSNAGSYEYLKSIAAEVRGIAQKRNITIFTAVQTNRSSYNNLEAGMETVSDSIGVGMFVDSLIMLRQTKEMKELGEIDVSFEKNRMSGITDSFKIGFDYSFMKFMELDGPLKEKDEHGLNVSQSPFKL